MEKDFMHKDITREVVMTMAVCGLVFSSAVASVAVANLGVEVQVAFAQITADNSGTAAVALASPTGSLSEAQIQAVIGLLASFNVNEATISAVDTVLHNNTGSNAPAVEPSIASSTQQPSAGFGGSRLPTATSSSTESAYLASHCTVPAGTLQSGMRGADVSTLQNFLISQGYMASSSMSGFFGTTTEGALKDWQDKQGIASSGDASSTGWGVFGPHTRLIMAGLCNPTPPPPHLGAPMGTQGPSGFNGRPNIASSSIGTQVPAPTCTLTSTQAFSSPNTVNITWTSTNAIYASDPSGGRDPANGSRIVTVQETTIFKKTVYGVDGSGTCYITVPVGSTDGSAPASTTVPTVQALAPANVNLASVAVAVAQLPFSIAINSLTNIFVQLGVGQ
jgi:hypothetical protein